MRLPEALSALRERNFRVLFLGQAVSLLGEGMVPVALAFAVLVAAAALFAGAGLMIFNALWEATLQAQIPPESLSRVSAYDWLGSLALNPLGAALVGPVAAGLGIKATLLGCAALATVVNVCVLLLPGVRRTRSRHVSPVTTASARRARCWSA